MHLQEKRPLVSVILAVKDGEKFLPSAIHSVLAQDYENYEMIVIDGQSTDRSAAIAKSFRGVRYICQEARGVGDAYNIGIDASTGEYISFISHDDRWTPEKLSVQLNFMLQHPKVLYTIARFKYFVEQGCSLPRGFRKNLLDGSHIGRIPETLVAHKPAFCSVGKLNNDLSIAHDLDWFARAADMNIPMAIIQRVLLYKRIHDTNTSMDAEMANKELLIALRESIERKRKQECDEK